MRSHSEIQSIGSKRTSIDEGFNESDAREEDTNVYAAPHILLLPDHSSFERAANPWAPYAALTGSTQEQAPSPATEDNWIIVIVIIVIAVLCCRKLARHRAAVHIQHLQQKTIAANSHSSSKTASSFSHKLICHDCFGHCHVGRTRVGPYARFMRELNKPETKSLVNQKTVAISRFARQYGHNGRKRERKRE